MHTHYIRRIDVEIQWTYPFNIRNARDCELQLYRYEFLLRCLYRDCIQQMSDEKNMGRYKSRDKDKLNSAR